MKDSFYGYRILGWQSFQHFRFWICYSIAFWSTNFLMRNQLLILLRIICMLRVSSHWLHSRLSVSHCFFYSLSKIYLVADFFEFIHWACWMYRLMFSSSLGIWGHYFFKYFFYLIPSLCSGNLTLHWLMWLLVFHCFLRLCLFFFFFWFVPSLDHLNYFIFKSIDSVFSHLRAVIEPF